MKPFFSVIIPLYNKEDYILATLESAINQSFKNFEIIIVNDGSTDRSLNIIQSIKNDKIKIITTANRGLSAARNIGIKNTNASYVAFLDADDLWMEDFLETINNLIKKNKKEHVFATAIEPFIKNKNISLKPTDYIISKEKHITTFSNLADHIITPSGLVVKKSVFKEIGYFDEGINYAEDEDFYIRCFKPYNLILYTEPKIYYRMGAINQMTAPNPNFKRIIPDFSKYINKENQADLKPYLDAIHYKLVVLYKMERNSKLVKFYKRKINTKNLSLTQKIKFHLPTYAFWATKSVYKKLLL